MLTKDQIDYLFRFCEKHLVFYFEVQVELVDHLAMAVEEEMAKNNKLSFESAVEKVFTNFGIFGFSSIVKERTKQLGRKYRKLYWRLFIEQFHWPQVLGFLAFSLIFYTVFRLNFIAGIVLIAIAAFAGIVIGLRTEVSFSKFLKKSRKKFLSAYGYLYVFPSWAPLFIILEVFVFSNAWGVQPHIGLLSILGGLYIVVFRANRAMTMKTRERLLADFPEAFDLSIN